MKKTRQSGFVLVFSVLALPIILTINGFSVALMDFYSGQVQTRIATSAAARAATEELCPQEKCWKSARKVASEMLTQYAINSGSGIKVSIPDVQQEADFENNSSGVWEIGELENKSTISIERGYLAEAEDPGPSGVPQSPTFHSLEKDSWIDGKIELISGACENDPDSDQCRSVPLLNSEPILPAWSFVNAVKVKVTIPQSNRLFKNLVPQSLLSVQESQVASLSSGVKQAVATGPFAIPLCSLLTQNKANGPLEFRPQEFEGIDILFTAADRNCKDPDSINCKNMPGYGLMPAFSASPATEFSTFQASANTTQCKNNRINNPSSPSADPQCLVTEESINEKYHSARYYHAVTRSNFGVIGGIGSNDFEVKEYVAKSLNHYELLPPGQNYSGQVTSLGSQYRILEEGLSDGAEQFGNQFFNILNKQNYLNTTAQDKNLNRTNEAALIDTNFSFFSIMRNDQLSKPISVNDQINGVPAWSTWTGLSVYQGNDATPPQVNAGASPTIVQTAQLRDLRPPSIDADGSSSNRVFTARNRGICGSALVGNKASPATSYSQTTVSRMFTVNAHPEVASTTWKTYVPIIYDFKTTCSQDSSNPYIDLTPQPANSNNPNQFWSVVGYMPITIYDFSLGIWKDYPNGPTLGNFKFNRAANYFQYVPSTSPLYPDPAVEFYNPRIWNGEYPDNFDAVTVGAEETRKKQCNFVRGRIGADSSVNLLSTPKNIAGVETQNIKDID